MEFRRASRLVKEYPRMLGRQRVSTRALAGMVAVLAAQGEAARANELLKEAEVSLAEIAHSPQTWLWEGTPGQLYYGLAVAHARLGDPELALVFLSKAITTGWRDVLWLSSDPEFASMRSHPRFQALQEELKQFPALQFKPGAAFAPH
jgi:hypothetical protein